jgi:hypothetical protein
VAARILRFHSRFITRTIALRNLLGGVNHSRQSLSAALSRSEPSSARTTMAARVVKARLSADGREVAAADERSLTVALLRDTTSRDRTAGPAIATAAAWQSSEGGRSDDCY